MLNLYLYGSSSYIMIRIKSVRTFDELDAIKNIWSDLEKTNGAASIFQSWVWNREWSNHMLCGKKNVQLDIKIVEDGAGHTLAILPFYKETLKGSIGCLIQFLGHRMTDQHDVLLADKQNPDLAEQVVMALREDLNCRTILNLRHLDQESQFTKQLYLKGMAEPMCQRLKVKANTAVTDQIERLGPSTRRRLRGQINKLKRKYGYKFSVKVGPDILDAFEDLVNLHCLRFASKGDDTGFTGEKINLIKEIMTVSIYTDKFEIILLQTDNKTIAATLMVDDRKNYFCFQTGFDPEFAMFSPMRILLTEAMRHGFDDLGCRSFDLGPGYEQYKYDWKPDISTNYMSCFGSGLYAGSLAAIYRVAFRRRLKAILPKRNNDA